MPFTQVRATLGLREGSPHRQVSRTHSLTTRSKVAFLPSLWSRVMEGLGEGGREKQEKDAENYGKTAMLFDLGINSWA